MVVTCWYIVEALIISNGVPVTSIAVYSSYSNTLCLIPSVPKDVVDHRQYPLLACSHGACKPLFLS